MNFGKALEFMKQGIKIKRPHRSGYWQLENGVKYRKKSVVIEAWQFTKENFKNGTPHFIKHSNGIVQLWSQYGAKVIGGEIKTLEGIKIVSENDYIVKGVNGEFYPCKPDIFEKTYELVEGEDI